MVPACGYPEGVHSLPQLQIWKVFKEVAWVCGLERQIVAHPAKASASCMDTKKRSHSVPGFTLKQLPSYRPPGGAIIDGLLIYQFHMGGGWNLILLILSTYQSHELISLQGQPHANPGFGIHQHEYSRQIPIRQGRIVLVVPIRQEYTR